MTAKPTIVVYGGAAEIAAGLSGFDVMILAASEVVDSVEPFVLVFDLRSVSVADVEEIRRRPANALAPVLLLTEHAVPDLVFVLLAADDAVVVDADVRRVLVRRLSLLSELARARRASDESSAHGLALSDDAQRRRFERIEALGTMVAGFAHEVRNPVAAMRSLGEELQEELERQGVDTPHVRLMLQMVERVERLVRTSLQFGRPAAPERAPHTPGMIVGSALSEIRPRLRGAADRLVVAVEPGLPDLNIDDRQLAQALVILLDNALDATGDAARVTVRVCSARSRRGDSRPPSIPPNLSSTVRFEVVDDGPGIPSEIVERIFDPFFTTKATGTGLGLSIAQQLVSENGGRLEVVSVPGGATSFTIVVPVEVIVAPAELSHLS